jgi:hypothetical protein
MPFTDANAIEARALAARIVAELAEAEPDVALMALSFAMGGFLAVNVRPEGWTKVMDGYVAVSRRVATNALLTTTEEGVVQ